MQERKWLSLGCVEAETQAIIDKDVIDPKIYVKNANVSWEE